LKEEVRLAYLRIRRRGVCISNRELKGDLQFQFNPFVINVHLK